MQVIPHNTHSVLQKALRSVLVIAVIILGLYAAAAVIRPAGWFVSAADRQAITDTIVRWDLAEAWAWYTLDGSDLEEVYANDPRGGELPPSALPLIQAMWQRPDLTAADVGYLDYRRTLFEYLKPRVEEREAIANRSIAAGFDYVNITPEEYAALLPTFAGVQPAWQRGPHPDSIPDRSQYLEIQSIEVYGDLARVIVRHGPTTDLQTLVKRGDRWYIVGSRTIKAEP
jgi:hypothetical protein